MPGRFPGDPPNLPGRTWNDVRRELYEYLRKNRDAVANSQKAPDTPTTILAGQAADTGEGPALALHDHVHDVLTAAAGAITLGQAASEGTSTALSRADHGHDTVALEAMIDAKVAGARAFAFFLLGD